MGLGHLGVLEEFLQHQTRHHQVHRVVVDQQNSDSPVHQLGPFGVGDAIGDELHRRGVLYAPDYAVNAGGLMNVSLEIDGYNRERAMRMMRTIYHTVGRIFDLADKENIAPQYAADRIAEARMTAIGKLKLPLGRTAPRFMGHLRGEH